MGKKINGGVVYRGPSQFDGEEIVAIATGLHNPSKNIKTGKMIQVYILRNGPNPVVAAKSGADKSICFNCPHRLGKRSCYINLGQAPLRIFQAFEMGGYPEIDMDAFDGKSVRFGAYGDPLAVPLRVWESIASRTNKITGYTHSWMDAPEGFKKFCMASVDTEVGYLAAQDNGWRTFRTKLSEEPVLENEMMCLNSTHDLTCEQCMLCSFKPTAKNIVVNIHGCGVETYRKNTGRV